MTALETFWLSPISGRYLGAWVEPDRNYMKSINRTDPLIVAARIISAVTGFFFVSEDQLKSKSRKREIVLPRQICMYLIKKRTKLSLVQTANMFGGRDHSTVIHSINTLNDLMDTDEMIKGYVQELDEMTKR